ncbi:MAG: transporter substrate-binding domain-containing protein [Streptococcaceae bacterium]|jgi:polar amino acid transport system substrate-binding protein|nr:transporter substrate-binding domain-containing protein [Streptococcaceae bacterium]
MKIKKFIIAATMLTAVFALAACSNGSSSSKSEVDTIKSNGKLVVALSPDYPPFEYKTMVDGKDKIVGADIDLANKIADKLGVKVELSPMSFDNILAAVSSGKADVAISAVSANPERKKTFDFSNGYYTPYNEIVIKKTELSKYSSLADFKGKTLAGQKGSTQEIAIKDQIAGASLVSLTDSGDEITEVLTGKVDGTVLEDMIAKSYVAVNPELAIANVKIPVTEAEADMAVAMKKGSKDLQKEINAVIKELKDSGEMEKIIEKNYTESKSAE